MGSQARSAWAPAFNPPRTDRPRRSRVSSFPSITRNARSRSPVACGDGSLLPPRQCRSNPSLSAKWPPNTRMFATHHSPWDSLRAARSVPRHWLRAGIRLRRTGLDALASRPSHRSRAMRAPARLRLAEMGPSYSRAIAVRIPLSPPKGRPRAAIWRRERDSNPR